MEFTSTEEKRGRGRPKKYGEKVVRAKNDPLKKWTADQALAKAGDDPLVALAEKQLPDGTTIPTLLNDPISRKHYILLVTEMQALDVDVVTYKRVIVQLAKLYAFQEACEKELKKIGGIAYKISGESGGWREHPAAKHLQTVRGQILTTLKLMNLVPAARSGGLRFEKEVEVNEFASLGLQ